MISSCQDIRTKCVARRIKFPSVYIYFLILLFSLSQKKTKTKQHIAKTNKTSKVISMSDVQFVDDCRCFVPCELYVSKILDIGLLLEKESRIKGSNDQASTMQVSVPMFPSFHGDKHWKYKQNIHTRRKNMPCVEVQNIEK